MIGLLGLGQIAQHPAIIGALNPLYGIELIVSDPTSGFILLGAVVLAVTGAEALYADMGHFGRTPIRRAWLGLVFPCLLLNYFGQGGIAARRCANAAKSVLPARTQLGGVPARDPRLRRDGDRLAGGDIGRLLTSKPSGTARLFATNAGAPHFRAGDGPGVRS